MSGGLTDRVGLLGRLARAALATLVAAWAAGLVVLPAAAVAARAGEFRADCLFSHRLMDDPIVRPGLPGAFHSHDFFGNRSTDALSSIATLRRGRSSCDPEADRSAYWVPTLYDARGRALTATAFSAYYTTRITRRKHVQPFPRGLKMLAGDMEARAPGTGPLVAAWACLGSRIVAAATIGRCPAGSRLELRLRFPDCWNGRDLDSRDHRRHVAYSVGGRCPRSRSVAVPALELRVVYPTRGSSGMSLASGPSFTAHGDFIDAWSPADLGRRVRRCLRGAVRCDPSGQAG